jgi:signal transduction histidine kinase
MGVVSRPPARALALDGLLALLLGVAMLLGTEHASAFQQRGRPQDALAAALVVVSAAALAGRRAAPLPTLVAVVLATDTYLLLHFPYGPVFLAPIVALFTVGGHLPVGRSAVACAATMLAIVAPEIPGLDPAHLWAGLASLAMWHGWLLVPWGIGAGLRVRRQSVRRDREEESRRLAYEERLRIAREVHDVVGHGLAVINMQAGVALHVVDRRPEQARVALDAIKRASKDALDELRATLAVFRSPDGAGGAVGSGRPDLDGGDAAARRPAPGLRDVDAVVAATTGSGLPVELVVTGRPVPLPAAVDLAAYRIVQESLTNVVRHAGAGTARVRLGYRDGELTIEVDDDGRAEGAGGRPAARIQDGPSGGNGIPGMRERAVALGGELQAGPGPAGGFRVRARLPLGASR